MLTVSDVIKLVGNYVAQDKTLRRVQLQGKTVDVSCYPSRTFFKIVDSGSTLNCISFHSMESVLKAGLDVLVEGKVGLYKGALQLIVSHLQVLGDDSDSLQQKLQQLGPDIRENHTISPYLWRVGVVSSLGAAGLRDYLQSLAPRRYQTVIYPTLVQGEQAPEGIVKCINRAIAEKMQAIVIVRGGGSREDLTAFDNLDVCRAICQSPIPVITGIGHQVDTVLADMVADGTCITPTDAASKMSELPGPSVLLAEAIYGSMERHANHLRRMREKLQDMRREEMELWKTNYHHLARALHQCLLLQGLSITTLRERLWRARSHQLDVVYNQSMREREQKLTKLREDLQRAESIRVLKDGVPVQSIRELVGEFQLILPDGLVTCIRSSSQEKLND